MIEQQDAAEALSQEDLIHLLAEPLKKMVTELFGPEEAERLAQVNRAKRNRFFNQGDQFVVPKWNDDGTADYAISLATTNEDDGSNPVMAVPVNMIRADGNKYKAVISQKPPAIKAVPDDMGSASSVSAAEQQQAVILDVFDKNKVRDQQRTMGDNQWLTGPSYVLCEFVTDGGKYGWSQQQTMEIQEVPGPNGLTLQVPQPGKPKKYANGAIEIRTFDLMNVRHQQEAKSIDDCHILEFAQMHHKAVIKSIHGKAVEDIDSHFGGQDGNNSTNQAMQAIADVQSIRHAGKISRKDYWLYLRRWFQPRMYALIEDKRLRDALEEQFPDGLHATWVKDKLVAISHERASDKWAVCKTGLSDLILGDALCEDSVPFQRALNDLVNLFIETVLRAIPRTVMDQSLVDREAMRDRPAVPNEIMFTKAPLGQKLDNLMAALPRAEVSPQLVGLANMLREFTIENNGIRPELYGGGQPANTFREALQRKNQAMQTVEPPYAQTQMCWADTSKNIITQSAKFATGILKPKAATSIFDVESEAVDLANLPTEGVHIEVAEGFPMTFSEMVGMLEDMLKNTPPEIAAALGLTDPINTRVIREFLLAIPGFKSPMEDGINKAEWVVKQLLAEQPIEQVDPMTGLPSGMMQPSIPPDEFDDHAFMAGMFVKWMNSKRGLKERIRNPQGFDNVKARWQAENQLSMPPPMPADAGADSGKAPAGPSKDEAKPGGPTPAPTIPPIAELEQAA